MKELTKAEEAVMQILWQLKTGFISDILEQMNEPKPAYNTVSTIVRILESKGFIAHKAYGRTHEYYPLISRETYRKQFLKRLLRGYFSGSYNSLVSFFTKNENLSLQELEELKGMIDQAIREKQLNDQKNKKNKS